MNTTHREKFPLEFIEGTLIGTLGSMVPNKQNTGYAYEAFILIAIGIEFLGACEDLYTWNKTKKGLNRDRFFRGLELFSAEYHQHKLFLYKKLRCGMAHIFAPTPGLGLGENKHNTQNLSGKKSPTGEVIQLNLNLQDFYNDFKNACEKVIDKINKEEYSQESKVYQPFLSVPIY